ncbi:PA14 domain-containing protein [Streptomyces sp. NPDC051909]|uniref:fibronectin type III domain-containing protein n=1 Tax=Streptomyces sp. NPDC051909 TaxID=3154944 RepID=UPI0034466115
MITRTRLRALATTATLAAAGGLLTATPASAAVTCTSPVWKAEFFANSTLSGTPRLTACDAAVNENYGYGDPAGVTLPADNFSVRWSVTRDFGSGGPFAFSAATQDGIRVYLDGVRKIDLWRNVSTTQYKTVNLTVPAGRHTIRVDYVAWTGTANVKFTYAPRTSATVDTVRPLAPTGLSSWYDRAGNRFYVSWAANKEMDLAGYRLYRRTGTAGWAKVSGTALLSAPRFTDIPPATGQSFLYEARAVDKAGHESTGSADVSVTTVDRTGPAAPTGVTVTSDSTLTRVSWPAVVDAARYEVSVSSAPTGPFELVGRTTATSYWTSAPENTLRYYRLQAFDALGNPSAYSSTITGDGVDRTPPQSPTVLDTYVRVDTTGVYWTAPAAFSQDFSNGGTYHVYRSPGTTLDPAALTRVTCGEDSHFTNYQSDCQDRDMAAGTYYTYAVATVDPTGNESALSAPVTVRTGDRVAPAPVTGLLATPRGDGIVLGWSAPADDDIHQYRAYRGVRLDDGTVRWLGGCATESAQARVSLCAHIADGETYVYTVVAVDRWGNSLPPSSPEAPTVTATELDLRPSVEVVQEGHLNGVSGSTLTFSAPHVRWYCSDPALCSQVDRYRISRWNPATQAYETLDEQTQSAAVTEYWHEDGTAEPGMTYFYLFEALRADGSAVMRKAWGCVYVGHV